MRCFIAIDLDKKLTNKVIGVQKNLQNLNLDVKLVEPENLHFTVKFLGDVNEDGVEMVKKSLQTSLGGERAFSINIKGMGYFGKPSHIKTLWLGLSKGEGELTRLMERVNDYVKIGESNFSPHLTMGRVKSGRNREALLKFLGESEDVNVGEMNVNEVKLKSSELTNKGPIYSDLAVFNLRL